MIERYVGAVTLTELVRIRYTMEALIQSENSLREQLTEPDTWASYPAILHDHYRHALEILWGWEQLCQRIDMLPENFLDKCAYRAKACQSIDRITLLEVYLRRLLNQCSLAREAP